MIIFEFHSEGQIKINHKVIIWIIHKYWNKKNFIQSKISQSHEQITSKNLLISH